MLAALAGCTHANGEPAAAVAPTQPSAPVREASAHSASSGPPDAPSATANEAANAARSGRARVHYDLAAFVERAELRDGQALIVDFGTRGDAKYSFGGWLSGAGESRELDGDSVLIVPGKVAKLALPAEYDGAAELGLRVRGLAAGPLTVHVNDQKVADLKLDGKQAQNFTLPIAAGVLARGDNLLQLRVARTGSAARLSKAGLAIDWLWLAPEGAGPKTGTPAALFPLAQRDQTTGAATLRVPAGHSLDYAFEVPARAELRALAQAGDGDGEVSVSALRDGKEPLVLAKRELSAQAKELAVDLGRFHGEIVRLELRATGGEVVLQRPRIETREPEAARAASKPVRNAIIVLVDTLRADKLTAYRAQAGVKTPGLDTFLQGAAVMLNARTQENWTKPSVATLLSSLLPWQHNAVSGDSKVPQSVELLPELLRERGFHTGAFIANGYVSDKFGFGQGWNTYRNYIREGRRSVAQYVAADVLQWLDERPQDKPFFLYMHTIDPHVPYKPPSHFLSMYDGDAYAGPVDFRRTNALLEKIKVGSIKLDARDKRRLEALYDGEISYHDVHFAAVMEGLKKRGLDQDTLVIVTADHGEEFWDHGSVGHGHSVYDELLHVPLIARIPGLTEGKQRVPDAVGLVDVMPTVLEALGQQIPEHLVGRSFLPELRGEDQAAPRAAVSGFMTGWRTIGVGRLKLIQRTIDHAWLYDVADDPNETRDVAAERPIARSYARGLLGLLLSEHAGESHVQKARRHKRDKTEIDAETEAQLKALGYVGTSAK